MTDLGVFARPLRPDRQPGSMAGQKERRDGVDSSLIRVDRDAGSARTAEPVTVSTENPLECADWDSRLPKHSATGFFHTAAWAAVLRETYGFRPTYFTARRNGEIEAVLPMMEVSSKFTGKRGVSLPFTDLCEPAGAPQSSVKRVIEEALNYGRNRGWQYVEWRGASLIDQVMNAARPSLGFFGHRLNLFSDTDFLFSKLDSAVRRAIRKAEKSGIDVEISQSKRALSDYYSLHCRTRRQHGVPPQPFRFFEKIHEHILARDLGIIVTAHCDDRPVASAIFFHKNLQAIYKFGASDLRWQEHRANNLVMWEAIKWCAGAGMKALHFGRTSVSNTGLRRYKLGWGAEEQEIHYHKFDLRRNEFVADRDNSEGWHTALFRSLPIFLNRWTGAVLYRHVA